MAALANPMIVKQPRARLLRIGEPLPAALKIEFQSIDPIWTWVVDDGNRLIAALIAAPGPGIAILLKICSLPSSSPSAMLLLLRKSLTDIHKRGYYAYMVCLELSKPMEAKLAKIAIQAGGLVMAREAVVICGKTDIGGL